MPISLESECIRVEIAPEIGCRIASFVDSRTEHEFLWRNPGVPLRREQPGAEYDPNFFGGIDELIPNDMPETICGIACPDHGELWTQPFRVLEQSSASLRCACALPLFGLELTKHFEVSSDELRVSTRIKNVSGATRKFLWKLHAAVSILPGDLIECPTERFEAVDPEWSRRSGAGEWSGEVVPEFDGSTEFLYLLPLVAREEDRGLRIEGPEGTGSRGEDREATADGPGSVRGVAVKSGAPRMSRSWMRWVRGRASFEVGFDSAVFPYCWYFASYGGFGGHHFAILEPCSSKPLSVNEAASAGNCTVLPAGGVVETEVVYRGRCEG